MERDEPVEFSWELKEIRSYLALEKIRFGDRLNVEYDIEYDEFLIPPLTVQALVENAVDHGISAAENGGTVRIVTRKLSDGGAQIRVFDDGVGPGMAEGAEHGFRAGEFLPADGAVGHVFTGTVVHAVRFDDVLRDGRPRLVRFRRHLGELHAAVGSDVAGEAVLRTACLLEHDKIAEIILMRPFGVAAPDRVQFFRGIVAQLHEGVCVQRAEDAPDPVPAGGLISRSGIRDQSRRGYDGRAATHGGAEKLSEPGHAVAFRFLRFLRFPRLFALGDFPLKDVFLPHGHGGFLKKGHVGIFRREFRIDAVLRLGREIFIIIPLIVHTVSAFREEGCGVLKPLWQSPGRIVNTNLL